MRGKYWALSMLVLALGCSAVLAPGAAARPKKKPKLAALLPDRSCKGLLSIGDFPGAASESSLVGGAFHSGEANSKAGSYFTTCQFAPPEATEQDPTPEGGGLDELAVFDRFLYEHPRNHNLTGLFPWPPGVTKVPLRLRSVTRGYWGTGPEGDGYGLMQVRNDVFWIARDNSTGMIALLSQVASKL